MAPHPPSGQAGRSATTPEESARALTTMRRAATGLLLAMTALFVTSHTLGDDSLAWGFARAFSEAAMVGGLADWFAVTAIFRRPLGLPIPHTAIIPRSKDRIGESVGRFIADNFLSPDLVAARVAQLDLSAMLGRWLADARQARGLAAGIVSAVPGLLDALDDRQVSAFLRRHAAATATGERLAPAAGSILEALAEQGRHQIMLDAALNEGFRLLSENEALIREKIRGRSGFLMRLVNVDRQVADALLNAVEDLLHDTAVNPDHPIRHQLTDLIHRFARDLKDDAELQARIGQIARETFSHASVTGALEAGWQELRDAVRRDCARPDSQISLWMEQALVNIGHGLVSEPEVRDALNVRIRSLLVKLAGDHGQDVARLVAETIRGWDADTVVSKLELSVGRDLQYIRLNGTVIGGLVGVALYAGGLLLQAGLHPA